MFSRRKLAKKYIEIYYPFAVDVIVVTSPVYRRIPAEHLPRNENENNKMENGNY